MLKWAKRWAGVCALKDVGLYRVVLGNEEDGFYLFQLGVVMGRCRDMMDELDRYFDIYRCFVAFWTCRRP